MNSLFYLLAHSTSIIFSCTSQMLTTEFHQHKLKQCQQTPNDALTGIPTTVNAVPIVEIPLITPTELAPVNAIS